MAAGRFFCHNCSVEINPGLDFTCPRCSGGFIEEILQQPAAEQESMPPFTTMLMQGLMGAHPGGAATFVGPDAASLEMILNNLMGVFGRFPQQVTFNLHGNPGDYAWGPGGLDTIITRLLNQMEAKGIPPAQTDQINSLPHIIISEEDIDKGLQCSVCMEDFQLAETVRQLPCYHLYHTDCIVPWLKLHGTCPVCRKTLDGQDTTKEEFNPPDNNPNSSTAGAGPSAPSHRTGNTPPYQEDLYEFD